MLYVNEFTEITDIEGEVPKPGLYVLVAQYYQPDKAEFEIPMNITYANPGEEMNVTTLIENGQFYEAVLPLPTCRSNSGCRTVIQPKDKTAQPEPSFNLNDGFHIHSEVNFSMTTLLTHTVAHSTKPSFMPKTNNQPPKKFLSLALS